MNAIASGTVLITGPTGGLGVSSPRRSGPLLASIVLDDRWAHLSDGAFVVKDEKRDVKPFAIDPVRESRLWEATAELLDVER